MLLVAVVMMGRVGISLKETRRGEESLSDPGGSWWDCSLEDVATNAEKRSHLRALSQAAAT